MADADNEQGEVEHAYDATIVLNYREASMVMACIDHALCYSDGITPGSSSRMRPLVDRMSSTFGFNTARLDRLLKGQRARKNDRAI